MPVQMPKGGDTLVWVKTPQELTRRQPARPGAGLHQMLLAFRASTRGAVKFLRDLRAYSRLMPRDEVQLADLLPQLSDGTPSTSVDPHYFHQAAWATARIRESQAGSHVDVGSDLRFVACLTGLLPVTFVDIRPPMVSSPNLTLIHGSILELPFLSRSVQSLSCLHVAEHVGLGRYGDPLDPSGTRLACAELTRVLGSGGHLFFSVPIGRSRTCFNAHRVLSPREVRTMFGGLSLLAFSVVDDAGVAHHNVPPESSEGLEYGCGMFHFRCDE